MLVTRSRYTGTRSLADTVLDTVFGEPLRWFQRRVRRILNRGRVTAERNSLIQRRERLAMSLGGRPGSIVNTNPRSIMAARAAMENAMMDDWGMGSLDLLSPPWKRRR